MSGHDVLQFPFCKTGEEESPSEFVLIDSVLNQIRDS